MCNHKAPHGVHISDEKHMHLYNEQLPLPETFHDDHATRATPARKKMRWTTLLDMKKNHLLKEPPEDLSDDELKTWNYQEHFQGYLKVVAAMDDNIGRLLDYLDEADLAQNTVIIYTSDNGFFLGDHGWFNKMWMYEESIRIPLLIRYPREIIAGSISNDMVLNLDFAPTFLDYADTKIPEDMQGYSFRKVMQGKTPDDWRSAFYYHYFGDYDVAAHYGIRNHSYKLIHFYQQDEWELYDLEKDPKEMKNVYRDPEYTGIIKDLKKDLIELKNKYKDH
jgi:arylsulfatase A-like enzyme